MKTVRKFICVLLSIMMAVSCCAVLGTNVYAEESTLGFGFDLSELSSILSSDDIAGLDIPDFDDIEQLIAAEQLTGLKFGPMSLEQIYDTKTPSNWSEIKNTGEVPATTFYLAMGNLNLFFRNFFSVYFPKNVLYSSYTATWLANKLVDIVFGSDHEPIVVELEQEEVGNAEKFFKEVLRKSVYGETGLVEWVQSCWVDAGVHFLPLCYALGVDLDDIWNKQNAQEICEEILLAFAEKFTADPLYFSLDVIWAITRSYRSLMLNPLKALFASRIAGLAGKKANLTGEIFNQPHELLNFLFNDCTPDKTDSMQFFALPYVKMGNSGDRVELFYYVFTYGLLVGSYKNNENVLKRLESNVYSYRYVDISGKDRQYIVDIIECFATANPALLINFTTQTAVDNVTGSITNWLWKIAQRWIEIFKEFVDRLDKIFGFYGRYHVDKK